MKVFKLKGSVASVAVVGMLGLMTVSVPATADVTGHLDLTTKYVLRGITTTYGDATTPLMGNAGGDAPENDEPALQGGLDYSHASGFYAGWWFSTLGYSYKSLTDTGTSMEHDLYGGYQGKMGDVGYKVGLTRYQYVPGFHSTAMETFLGVSYKEFGLNAQTLLDDVTYGNQGDTYFTATYGTTLSKDIGFNASLGYYTYKKTGEFIDPTGANPKAVGSAFRHLTLGLSYPFTKNVTAAANYIIGGDNRWGVKQDDQLVGSLSYTF